MNSHALQSPRNGELMGSARRILLEWFREETKEESR